MYVRSFLEMLVCEDITVPTLCTKLTYHHAVDQIGSILHNNSYSTVVANRFL